MNASQTQQAQTVTNKLSGEKTYQEVQFAITGVPQADLLAGISAVVDTLCKEPGVFVDRFVIACIFESLAKQYFESDRRDKLYSDKFNVTQPVPSPFTNPVPLDHWPSITSSSEVPSLNTFKEL